MKSKARAVMFASSLLFSLALGNGPEARAQDVPRYKVDQLDYARGAQSNGG
jgi:hypothetical protein